MVELEKPFTVEFGLPRWIHLVRLRPNARFQKVELSNICWDPHTEFSVQPNWDAFIRRGGMTWPGGAKLEQNGVRINTAGSASTMPQQWECLNLTDPRLWEAVTVNFQDSALEHGGLSCQSRTMKTGDHPMLFHGRWGYPSTGTRLWSTWGGFAGFPRQAKLYLGLPPSKIPLPKDASSNRPLGPCFRS